MSHSTGHFSKQTEQTLRLLEGLERETQNKLENESKIWKNQIHFQAPVFEVSIRAEMQKPKCRYSNESERESERERERDLDEVLQRSRMLKVN